MQHVIEHIQNTCFDGKKAHAIDIYDALLGAKVLHEGASDSHMWCGYQEKVVKIGDMYISFVDCIEFGDECNNLDMHLEDIDNLGIVEVVPVLVTSTEYRAKGEKQ